MDKIRALRYFKCVSELSSFSLAAKVFDVPPSSISRRIKDLENELGIELLQRTPRNVSTTELGSVYYDMIVEVLQRLDNADELISQRFDALEGKIRISCMANYGERVLAPVLLQFRQQYPSIIFDLDYSDDLITLGHDSADIAIRAGKAPDERVVAKLLSSTRLMVVATPKLLCDLQKRYGKTIFSVEDLKTCPALQNRGQHGSVIWWALRDDRWDKIEVNPVLYCNSGDTLLAATLAHEGLSVYPYWWVKDYLSTGALVEVPLETAVSIYPKVDFDLFILYQQAKYKIPKIKCCVDFIMRHLS